MQRLSHLGPADRLYCALPLHHASGGVMALSACLQSGACLVHRPRFSASSFSRDVALHRCTHVQYIGEMCRYRRSVAGGARGRARESERELFFSMISLVSIFPSF